MDFFGCCIEILQPVQFSWKGFTLDTVHFICSEVLWNYQKLISVYLKLYLCYSYPPAVLLN